MARKLIYFVRHGQTENNAKEIRQGEEGGLSEKGRAQALATAKRFPKTKGCPQTIISSPYERAKETAAILSKELNVHIEYSPLLVERKNPTEIVGRPARDKQVKEIADMIDGSYHADEFQMSDEETFIDLKVRTRKLLDYIMDRPEERMIMVTHSRFLKMIVSYMLLG
ncbi:MAG: histidine phosphatase family protein, partial [Patescibacteria group bacterium]